MMRLTCPRCGAEYEVEDRLIPAGGREVQCSSCDNVWFQLGRLRMVPPAPLPPAAAAQEEAPRMGRALPEDVMDILRDEAAHFRASHPGLDAAPAVAAPADPDAVADDAPVPVAEVATPAGPEPVIAPDVQSAPASVTAEETSNETAMEAAEAIAALEAAAKAPVPQGQASPPATPATAMPQTGAVAPAGDWSQSEPARRGGGFGRGFLIGLILAAGFYALYRAAPGAGDGVWGDVLRSIRAAGDAFHHWVQARITAFR